MALNNASSPSCNCESSMTDSMAVTSFWSRSTSIPFNSNSSTELGSNVVGAEPKAISAPSEPSSKTLEIAPNNNKPTTVANVIFKNSFIMSYFIGFCLQR